MLRLQVLRELPMDAVNILSTDLMQVGMCSRKTASQVMYVTAGSASYAQCFRRDFRLKPPGQTHLQLWVGGRNPKPYNLNPALYTPSESQAFKP